ncbi:MAG: FAD-dependent oxidoreductase, partial [Phycisphaerae bacterium]|nr:FAD-dependent oxidoreductase [Phycisphaerae bacterium]
MILRIAMVLGLLLPSVAAGESMARYNVVWDSPSKDNTGQMPLGNGDIAAGVVVNCAGIWARDVGLMCGVNVPLHACEHFYVVTEPIPDLPTNLPVLRDMDSCAYHKVDAGKLLVGAFEHNAKPWGMDGIPEDFEFDQLPEDFDHFAPVLEGAMHRNPILETAGIQT